MNATRRHAKTTLLFRIVAVGTALLCGAAFLCFHNPETTPFFPKCLWHAATGLHCPGCGSGRALYAALHGDLLRAFRLNVLLFPMLMLVALLIWKPRLALNPCVARTTLFVILAFWLLRNIPAPPFSLLAPNPDERIEAKQ